MEYAIKRAERPCYLAMAGEPDGDWTDSLWSAWGGNLQDALSLAATLAKTSEGTGLVVVEIRRGSKPGELVEGSTIVL